MDPRLVVPDWRRIAVLAAIVLSGCGRISFEQTNHLDGPWDGSPFVDANGRDVRIANDSDVRVDGQADSGTPLDAGYTLPECFADNFDDGNGDSWTMDGGGVVWEARAGRESFGWGVPPGSGAALTQNPAITLTEEFEIDLDVLISDGGAGDFYLFLYSYTGNSYQYYFHPSTGDEAEDVVTFNAGAETLASTPTGSFTAGEWHHVRLVRTIGGNFDIAVDGVSMLLFTDERGGPPYILDMGFFAGGVLDSVRVGCR